jgi:DNA-binding response OmpR family regulator
MGDSPAKRILIADDEPLYLLTTAAPLRKHGFDCVCVPKTAKAVPAFEVGAE